MNTRSKAPQYNLSAAIFFSLIIIALTAYSALAFRHNSLFWGFANTARTKPTHIVIIDNGQQTTYKPGDLFYERLSPVIRSSISQLPSDPIVTIGLSKATLDDFQHRFTIMEVHYDQPLDFGMPAYRGTQSTKLLFPITGRHAATGLFFRGNNTHWIFGGIQMQNPAVLYTTLESLGFTVAVHTPESPTESVNSGNQTTNNHLSQPLTN